MTKKAVAIKQDGTTIMISLPKDPNEERKFILSVIGDNPQPTEMFFLENTEVFWTLPSSKNYFSHPENQVATLVSRNLYDMDLGVLRGNVLITGIGAKDGFVDTINEKTGKIIVDNATAIKNFLQKAEEITL